jgi:hypothetical protein
MKSCLKIIAAVVIMVSFTTCKKDSDENVVGAPLTVAGIYPLVVGNEWTYYKEMHLLDDTTLIDSIFYQGYCIKHIDRVETLPNNAMAFACEYRDSTATSESYTGTQFYNTTSTGLYEEGYYFGSSGGVYLMPQPQIRYSIAGMEFNSLFELLSTVKNGSPVRADSTVVNNPHKLLIKHPLSLNDEWTYTTTPWLLKRKYVGDETVHTAFGSFICKKIEWLYDLDNDGTWDDIHVYEYISQTRGLLKEIVTGHVTFSDISGNPIATGFLTDEAVAISINF